MFEVAFVTKRDLCVRGAHNNVLDHSLTPLEMFGEEVFKERTEGHALFSIPRKIEYHLADTNHLMRRNLSSLGFVAFVPGFV